MGHRDNDLDFQSQSVAGEWFASPEYTACKYSGPVGSRGVLRIAWPFWIAVVPTGTPFARKRTDPVVPAVTVAVSVTGWLRTDEFGDAIRDVELGICPSANAGKIIK
jgi:hypothetical protein